METITAISVSLSYALAVAIIFLGYFFSGAKSQLAGLPPPLMTGKVSVWFYRPLDWVGFAGISGAFFLMMMMGFIFEMLDIMPPQTDEPPKIMAGDVLFSIGYQIFMAGVAVTIVSSRISPSSWLGLSWRQWPLVFVIAPVTVVAMWAIFAGLYAVGWMDFLEKLGVEQVQDAVVIFQEEKDMFVVILMAIAAMIVAPICEEIVFRGYLYPVAKKYAGPWAAGIATALIFSAVHGSMSALLPLFIFGMVLVLLYELTGSIWAPMAVHFLFNSATVVIQMLARFGYIPDGAVQ